MICAVFCLMERAGVAGGKVERWEEEVGLGLGLGASGRCGMLQQFCI